MALALVDQIGHHPKIGQGIALTTTGVSGAVQYAERTMGLTPDNWSAVGIMAGAIASGVVVWATIRRDKREAQLKKLDAELKQLEIERNKIVNEDALAEQKKRRESGEPMRRKTDM